MTNTKGLLEKLPSKWNDIKLYQYKKISDLTINESDDPLDGVDNTLSVIASLLDIPVEELEALPMKNIQAMASKMAFIAEAPKPTGKSPMKMKTIEQITYNDYVTYIQLSSDPIHNMTQILKTFSTDGLSEEEIDGLGMEQAMNAFFLLRIIGKTYINSFTLRIKFKLIRVKIKEKIIRFWQSCTAPIKKLLSR
jgi:hypothetical protein